MKKPNYEALTEEQNELVTYALGLATGQAIHSGDLELGHRLLQIHNVLHNCGPREIANSGSRIAKGTGQ